MENQQKNGLKMTEPCSKEKEIERLVSAVFGNGVPGIKEHVAVMEQQFKQILEKISTAPSPSSLRIASFLGGFVAVALSGIGVIALKHFGII